MGAYHTSDRFCLQKETKLEMHKEMPKTHICFLKKVPLVAMMPLSPHDDV